MIRQRDGYEGDSLEFIYDFQSNEGSEAEFQDFALFAVSQQDGTVVSATIDTTSKPDDQKAEVFATDALTAGDYQVVAGWFNEGDSDVDPNLWVLGVGVKNGNGVHVGEPTPINFDQTGTLSDVFGGSVPQAVLDEYPEGGGSSTGMGSDEVNGAASITTNGGAVSLTLEEADALLHGNGVAPLQNGSVAADVTVTGTISVAEASSVLGTNYNVVDDAAIIAEAITAGAPEVNGATSLTTDGPVELGFADADSLLNGNGSAPDVAGILANEVTVTGDVTVAQATKLAGAIYSIEDTRDQLLVDGVAAPGVAGAQEVTVDGIINQQQYDALTATGTYITAPGLDPSADEDGESLTATVDRFDILTGFAESGDVTVTLDGVDDDIVDVSVTVTDGERTVDATVTTTDTGFVVGDINVSTLADGDLDVHVTATDAAGNTATASTSFVLDSTADADDEPLTLSIPQTDGVVGFELSGVDVVDTVGIHLDLVGETGSASIDLSVDPADLAETGLGVLARAVGAADQLQGLLGELREMPEALVNMSGTGRGRSRSRAGYPDDVE